MRRTGLTIAAFLALAGGGCTTSMPAVPAERQASASIAMETFSWGRPFSSWRVDANGEGSYTYAREIAGGAFRDYDLVTHVFSAGREGYSRLERLLAGAARGYECEIQVTDALYGTITWSRAAPPPLRRNFNLGCLSPEAELIQGQMVEAGELVRSWALGRPATQTREVREPRP